MTVLTDGTAVENTPAVEEGRREEDSRQKGRRQNRAEKDGREENRAEDSRPKRLRQEADREESRARKKPAPKKTAPRKAPEEDGPEKSRGQIHLSQIARMIQVHEYLKRRWPKSLQGLGVAAPRVTLEKPRDAAHGDIATNVAMVHAKELGMNPRALAEKILADAAARTARLIAAESIAGPGFINFTFAVPYLHSIARQALKAGERFGENDELDGQKILIEFVSANPSGPLNVVSARAAAVGDSLARLFRARGAACETEFYVNDAGNQVRLLGESVRARYETELGHPAGDSRRRLPRRVRDRTGAGDRPRARRALPRAGSRRRGAATWARWRSRISCSRTSRRWRRSAWSSITGSARARCARPKPNGRCWSSCARMTRSTRKTARRTLPPRSSATRRTGWW